jgi:hypothetical protein
LKVLAFLGTVLVLVLANGAAEATGARLNDRRLEQLHQEICGVPVHKTADSGGDIWVCDRPRDYPGLASDETCPLSFVTSGENGLTRIYYGQFTAREPQAIAMYYASCEPHSNNFGGMALFKVVDRRFKLLRYFPGEMYVDCAVPPSRGRKVQVPYCFSSYLGQGVRVDLFGPLRFSPDGRAYLEKWLEAGNLDGFLTTMTPCDKGKPGIHHLMDVAFDRSKAEIVVGAASIDPQSFATACDRYRKNDFNEQERGFRNMSDEAKSQAFIRPDENRYVKLLIRYRVPKNNPAIKVTPVPVPQD